MWPKRFHKIDTRWLSLFDSGSLSFPFSGSFFGDSLFRLFRDEGRAVGENRFLKLSGRNVGLPGVAANCCFSAFI
jgi:hypothetical protein